MAEPVMELKVDNGGISSSNWNKNEMDSIKYGERNVPEARGCWRFFTSCVCGMWSTRDMMPANAKEKHSEAFVRMTIRELVTYCIFLAVLCFMTFGMTSNMEYYYPNMMGNLFWEGSTVSDVPSLWQFLDSVYWEYDYNSGDSQNFICPDGTGASDGPCPGSPEDKNILYENILLGVPRLRQLRVRNGTCLLHPIIQQITNSCYSAFVAEAVDTRSFNQSAMNLLHANPKAWQYQSAEALNGVSSSGVMGTYTGGGSIQDLTTNKSESGLIIAELMQGNWIGRETRFVAADFTVYNANINLFCIITFMFELPATGGVVPTLIYHPVKLLRYVNSVDYVVMTCEFIYIGFVVYYFIEEIIEIRHNKMLYFRNVWHLLDIIVIAVSFVNIILIGYAQLVTNQQLAGLLANIDEFANFTQLDYWATMTNNILALCLFFSVIKLLKYITFNRTMIQLSRTLGKCANDLIAFTFLFMVAFVAFAQAGSLIFGRHMRDYSTITDSTFSLLRMVLGDFDYPSMMAANPILGRVFFCVFHFVIFLIMMNVYLAIIMDTFVEVKAEIEARKIAYEMSDYFRLGYTNIRSRFGDKIIDIESALKLANTNEDGNISYEEVRQILKRANFSALEIEMFFAKYDTDDQAGLTTDETGHVLDDMQENSGEVNLASRDNYYQGNAAGMAGSSGDGSSGKVFEVVTLQDIANTRRRVDQIESSLGFIVHKIDGVLAKMEAFELDKIDKRDFMDQIFDPKRRDSTLGNIGGRKDY